MNEDNAVPQSQSAPKKLDDLVQETQFPILVVHSIFPFQLFPDALVVEVSKISIVHKSLFFKSVIPILIDSITDFFVSRNPFFAAIEVKYMGAKPVREVVRHLHPKDAANAKRVIVGLIYAKKMGVNLSKISKRELLLKLESIGEGNHEIEKLT